MMIGFDDGSKRETEMKTKRVLQIENYRFYFYYLYVTMEHYKKC